MNQPAAAHPLQDRQLPQPPSPRFRVQDVLPFLMAVAALGIILGAAFFLTLLHNQGHLSYSLDDPYIHMAIAKNLARHGVWGVTPYQFSAASSSPFWTLLLAGVYRLFGVSDWLPLLLNVLAAVGALWVADRMLRRHETPPLARTAILVGLLLLVPLPAVVFTGMEHSLQILMTLLLMDALDEWLVSGEVPLRLYGIAAVLALTRYEAAFLILPAAALLWMHGRGRAGALLLLLFAVPVLLFGLYSVRQGGFWLPNSVLLKGGIPHDMAGRFHKVLVLAFAVRALRAPAFLLFGMALGAVGSIPAISASRDAYRRSLIWWTAGAVLFHLEFVPVYMDITDFRYQGAILTIALLALALCRRWIAAPGVSDGSARNAAPRAIFLAASAALGIILGVRAAGVMGGVVQASTNIYQQQHQMARFMARYYPTERVALNDIGAVNFRSSVRCLDLQGLASNEMAEVRRRHVPTRDELRVLTERFGCRIAIIYDRWFPQGRPEQWEPVGEWMIPNNVICGDSRITFYAIAPGTADALAQNLERFSHELPPGVEWRVSHVSRITTHLPLAAARQEHPSRIQ